MSLKINFALTSKWSNGGQGNITVTNVGSSVVSNWKVTFIPLNFSVSGLGNFSLVGGSINTSTSISTASWDSNKNLNVGQSVSSDFNVSGDPTKLQISQNGYIFTGEVISNESSTPIIVPTVPIVPTPVTPITSNAIVTKSGKRCIVYYPNYAIYGRKYFPTNIQLEYITDILVSFLTPMPSKSDYDLLVKNWNFPIPFSYFNQYLTTKKEMELINHDQWADMESSIVGSTKTGVIGSLVELKKKYPHLKVGIAVGGWSLSWIFSKMSDINLRNNFVNSVVNFILTNGLDSVNIDWEFISKQGIGFNHISPQDPDTMAKVLQELRNAFDKLSPNKHIEVTATIGADPEEIAAYKKSIPFVDWLGIMSYDLSGSWSNDIDFHAGLYRDPSSKLPVGFSASESIENSLTLGIDSSKVIMGIPAYGRGWKTAVGTQIFGQGMGAAKSLDPSDIAEDGNTSWNSINSAIKSGTFKDNIKDSVGSAWGIDSNNQIFTYDNPKTVEIKVDYMNSKNLGGFLFWDLCSDVRDLSSPDSLIGTAVRKMNLGTTTTPPIVIVPTPPVVPVIPPVVVNPTPVTPVTPVITNGGLKCISVTLKNDSTDVITIKPGETITLSVGSLKSL